MSNTDRTYDVQPPMFVSHFPLRGRGVVLVLNPNFQGEVPRNGFLALNGKQYKYVGPEFLRKSIGKDMAVIVPEEFVGEILEASTEMVFLEADDK